MDPASWLFAGIFDLPWWGMVLVVLGLTHVTIAAVTIYLHRCQAHRALDLHPLPAHFFRLWLWMTTGMITKEWAAIHRKHHAKCETAEDPHSPQIYGINRVLWGGVFLYVKESHNRETMERYGHGTPDDWMERNVYTRYTLSGLTAMGLINVALFGLVPGLLVLFAQIAWIPFWAAGVINGIGHFWGYRNWQTADASTNIIPDRFPDRRRGAAQQPPRVRVVREVRQQVVRVRPRLGVHPHPGNAGPGPRQEGCPAPAHRRGEAGGRHGNPARGDREPLRRAGPVRELAQGHLRRGAGKAEGARAAGRRDPQAGAALADRDDAKLAATERAALEESLAKSKALQTAYSMRQELTALWNRSSATREQLVAQLQDWCHRAEGSGIGPLREFSMRLRSYA